ncbi:V-type ATP synthase subunit I [Peptoniphilus faecalis]|uniref:V-type ATP synthase subunit I n=1 Tax=Peptoniphilus faecalis TaxID=2731255 RepID=UPI002E2C3E17|nr:V-type ATPase 116kDa subunit family protein [Peptoniphilus faecalis]
MKKLAVEKMKVANIIGNISDMDSVVLDILNLKCMQFMSTEANIAENKFTFSLDNEENLERNLELNYISPIEEDQSHKSTAKKATEIMDFLGFDKIDEYYFEKVNVKEDIDSFVKNISDKINEYEKTKENLKILDTLKENYELFKNVDIDLKDIADLKYFNSRFGFLDKDARQRLKKNYGNILAMIYHTGTVDNRELFLVIYPREAEKDVDRLLNSLNFTEVELLGENVEGTANLIYKNLEEEEENVKRKIFEIEEYKKNLLESRNEELKTTLAHMLSYEGIEKAKRYMLKSNKYFYLSGWIGDSDKSKLEKKLSKYRDLDIKYFDPKSENMKTPTKLKNANFFKPFELLINMYGTPNYGEFDPTVIFGITYMILFGAMFGDLGQGAVFAIAGLILRKKNKDFGGLLLRMGASSMFFGLMYGSVFGSEEIIRAMWFRPFENINDTLVIAIYFGIILLAIAYGIGIYNRLKSGKPDEAFFSKEGFLGVLIFVAMINIGMNVMGAKSLIPMNISLGILVISLIIMLLKRPILKILFNKEAEGSAADYYIESSFGLLEALLSTMSSIISFIRVGAFAINHVGLFLAFKTLGEMVGSSGGNIAVLIFGNILILGLEGLIVFIQSLRLEYYEMFSKYYSGDGILFEADRIY